MNRMMPTVITNVKTQLPLVIDGVDAFWHCGMMKTYRDQVFEALEWGKQQYGSYRQLAENAGLNSSTVTRWVDEKRDISLEGLDKVFSLLGIKILIPGCEPESGASEMLNLKKHNLELQRQLELAQKEHAMLSGEIRALERRLDKHEHENAQLNEPSDKQIASTG